MCIKQSCTRAVVSTSQSKEVRHRGPHQRQGQAHMLARSMFLRLRIALESSPWQMRAAGKSTVSRNLTADMSVGFCASSCGVLHGDKQPLLSFPKHKHAFADDISFISMLC